MKVWADQSKNSELQTQERELHDILRFWYLKYFRIKLENEKYLHSVLLQYR